MTTNPTHPEPVPAGARLRHQPEALAEAAWRHLLNRHQLAAALDQLGASPDDPAQLHAAVTHLTQRGEAYSPTPHDPPPDGESR